MSFNKVILMGNLTRDVEVRQAGSSSVAAFGVASSRKFKTAAGEDKEETVFVDCESWGKQGEVIAKYFGKGKPILVEGRLKLDQWEDKDGSKRSKLKVVVESFSFVGSKGEGGAPTGEGAKAARGEYVPSGDRDVPF